MTAETQGLQQGFNDEHVNVPPDEVAPPRPRPVSEAIIGSQVPRERQELQAEVDAGDVQTVGNPGPGLREQAQPPASPQGDGVGADPWADFTKKELADAIRGVAPEDATLAAYDHNERKVTKPQLVAAAVAAGLKVEEEPQEPAISEEAQARIAEIDALLADDDIEEADAEALRAELATLQGEPASA